MAADNQIRSVFHNCKGNRSKNPDTKPYAMDQTSFPSGNTGKHCMHQRSIGYRKEEILDYHPKILEHSKASENKDRKHAKCRRFTNAGASGACAPAMERQHKRNFLSER